MSTESSINDTLPIRGEPTAKTKFEIQVRASIEFEFGSLCDYANNLGLDEKGVEHLKSRIRTAGNNCIRVINNHLEYYNVSRNHAKEKVNPERVIRRAKERG